MHSLLNQRWATLVVTVCLIGGSIMQPALAGVISTEMAIELNDRQITIDQVNAVLAQDNVRDMLAGMGVEPEDAIARVNSLTDEELYTLQQSLDKLPAGAAGVIEVVGIVAIVLIVLELLNVTNFFSEF